MAVIERISQGPPIQRCEFDTENGKLLITVEDPLTNKPAAACAITLGKSDAGDLLQALDAFRRGATSASAPFAIVRVAPDPFLRVCMFHAPSGELAISLACQGGYRSAADATIMLRSSGGGDDDVTVLRDALEIFAEQ